jgi:hypothetical protein
MVVAVVMRWLTHLDETAVAEKQIKINEWIDDDVACLFSLFC